MLAVFLALNHSFQTFKIAMLSSGPTTCLWSHTSVSKGMMRSWGTEQASVHQSSAHSGCRSSFGAWAMAWRVETASSKCKSDLADIWQGGSE